MALRRGGLACAIGGDSGHGRVKCLLIAFASALDAADGRYVSSCEPSHEVCLAAHPNLTSHSQEITMIIPRTALNGRDRLECMALESHNESRRGNHRGMKSQ